jgi:GNAT superfamily N-acetyltransferase
MEMVSYREFYPANAGSTCICRLRCEHYSPNEVRTAAFWTEARPIRRFRRMVGKPEVIARWRLPGITSPLQVTRRYRWLLTSCQQDYCEHMVSIRAATQRDAVEISHVHVLSWRTTYAGIVPDEYLAALNEAERVPLWREWLTRDVQVYIADLDGKVIGFISGGPIREPVQNYDAELFAIYLLEQTQRHGIGTALLRELAGSLISKGFTSLAVWVLERNPSRHFYVKSGAQLVTSKEIETGGAMLSEVAYGWPNLEAIRSPK